MTLLSLAIACCFGAGGVSGQPQGPQVVSGQASFVSQGNSLIVSNSPNAIINWQGFSIGVNELTRFNQQSAASAVLNRVIGADNSAILGALQSNGQVYLINPNGIFIGPHARIDVAGLVAGTLDLSNQDFLAGRYNFQAGVKAGNLVNQGGITTPEGGRIYLIAPNIENSGILTSPKGDITLAAGHSVQLVDSANPHLQVVVSAPQDQALNLGQILAQSGKIGIYGALINHKGKLNADSAVVGENGKIFLKAVHDTLVEGGISATGVGRGGEIQVLGERVGILDGAKLNAGGQSGGGTILVGGDYQGKNALIQNAQRTYVGAQAEIKADAQHGDGGKIIVWSNEATRVYGSLSAKGGKGGFIETSGHHLDVAGVKVDTGKGGVWLLDPYDIEIVASGGSTTLSDFDQFADPPASGVSLLDSATIANYTPSGTSGSSIVALQASHDITLSAPLSIVASGIGVNMKAGNDININAALSSNNGAITLSANDTGGPASGSGMLNVSSGGSIASNGGTINISAVDINLQGPLSAGSGNLTVTSFGAGNIGLGGEESSLTLSNSELQKITAAKLIVDAGASGVVYSDNVSATDSQGFATLEINGGGAVFRNNPSVFKSLAVNVSGFLDVIEGGSVATTAGDITITAADVDLSGSVSAKGGAADVSITATSGRTVGVGGIERQMSIDNAELQNITARDLSIAANGEGGEVAGVTAGAVAGVAGKVVLAGQSISFVNNPSTFKALTVNAEQGIHVHQNVTTTVGDLRLDANSNATPDYYDEIAVDGGITLSAEGNLVFGNAAHGGSSVNVGPHYSLDIPQGDATFVGKQGIEFNADYNHNGAGHATTLTAGTFQTPTTIRGNTINAGDNTLTIHGNLEALGSELRLYGRSPQVDGTLSAASLKVVNTRNDCVTGYACDIGLGASFGDRSGITWIDPGKVSADSVWLETSGGSIEVRSVNKPAWDLVLRAVPYEVVEAAEPPIHNVYGGMIAFTSGASTVGTLTAQAGNGINVEHSLSAASGELNLDAHYNWSIPSEDVSIGYNPVLTIAGGASTPTTLSAADTLTLNGSAVNIENGSAAFIAQTGHIDTDAAIAASATEARVTFEATAGALRFNGSPGTKISADEAVIKTRNGVVAPDDTLLTSVSRLQVEFSGGEDAGDMSIVNNKAGGLELANLDGSAGGYAVYQSGGEVDIRTATTSLSDKTYGQNLSVTGKVVAAAGAGDIMLAVIGSADDVVPTTLDVQNVIKHEGTGSIILADISRYYDGQPVSPATLVVGAVNGQPHTVETTQGNISLKFADAALSGGIKAGATGSDRYAANEGVVTIEPRYGYDGDTVWTLSSAGGWIQGINKFYANRLSFNAGQQPLTLNALDLSGAVNAGYIEFKTVECGECIWPDLNINGPLVSPVSVGFVAGESLNLNAGGSITSAGSVNLITDVLSLHATAGNITAATGDIVVAPYTASKGVAVSLTDPGEGYPEGGGCGPGGCGGSSSDLWLNSSRLDLFNAPSGNLQIGWQNSNGAIATVGDIVFYDPVALTNVQGLVLRTQGNVVAMIPPLYSQNPLPAQKIISAPQGIDIRSGGIWSDATISSNYLVLQTDNIQLGDDGRFVASSGVSLAPYNYTANNSFITVHADCGDMVCSSVHIDGDEEEYEGIIVNPTWLDRVVTPNLDLGHQTCANGVCTVDFAGNITIAAPLAGSEASFKNLGLLTQGGIYQEEDSPIGLPDCANCGGLAAEAHNGDIDLSYAANSVSYLAAKAANGGIYFWNDKTLTIANANNIHGVTSNGGEIVIWVDNGDLVVGGALPGISTNVYYSGINACPTSGACGDVYLDAGGALRGLIGVTHSVVGSYFEADTRNGMCAGLECSATALPFATQVAQLDLENKLQEWDLGEGGIPRYTITGSIKVVNNSVTHSAALEIVKAENAASLANGGGNVSIDNYGATTVGYEGWGVDEQWGTWGGAVSALSGAVSIAAHSPLTVNGGSTVSAASNVSLSAGQGSGGNDNLVLNGSITSTSGSIALSAYNGITVEPAATLAVSSGGGGISATATTGAIAINAPAASISMPSGNNAGIVLTAGGAISGAPPGAVTAPNTTPGTTPPIGNTGTTPVVPTLSQCTLNPALAGCSDVLPTLAQCTLNPAAAGCSAVLPSTSQCTLNPSLAGCSAVLPTLNQCALNPALAGCGSVLPSTDQCATNPGLIGCGAVLPSLAQCSANPALAGCSAVLPSLVQCAATPSLAGCSSVLPSVSQCVATPSLPGCAVVLPSTNQCAANPSLSGCTVVLPTLAQCTSNPALSGCASVLPTLAQCSVTPSLAGCAAVLPSASQCAANPTLSGCATVLPTLSQCVATPSLAGCAAVLPSLVQCAANPSLSGCATVLPSLAQCAANPNLAGCAAVLPSAGQCAANPTLAGCATVLPTLGQCVANPSLSGCAAVLPSASQCAATPSLAGCAAVLPSAGQCAANPSLAGCSAVLPTLGQCVANPGLNGCAAVLPSASQCAANPALTGCTQPATTDPCVANPNLPSCTPTQPQPPTQPQQPTQGESQPLDQAINQTNNSVNNSVPQSVVQPLVNQANQTNQSSGSGGSNTSNQSGGATTQAATSGAGGSDDKDDKKEVRKESPKRSAAAPEEKKNEAPVKKQYCN